MAESAALPKVGLILIVGFPRSCYLPYSSRKPRYMMVALSFETIESSPPPVSFPLANEKIWIVRSDYAIVRASALLKNQMLSRLLYLRKPATYQSVIGAKSSADSSRATSRNVWPNSCYEETKVPTRKKSS